MTFLYPHATRLFMVVTTIRGVTIFANSRMASIVRVTLPKRRYVIRYDKGHSQQRRLAATRHKRDV